MADYLPFGAGSPAEQAEVGPSFFDRLVAGIINGTVSIPKRVMDATAATAPGLRREDFTDIPATPAPFGFSRPEEHPGSEMRGAALEEAFKGDRSRKAQYGVDMWDKNHRYTPREWVAQAKDDLAKGENSYVWTSIPDKVTEQLRRLGYDGILDTGGKGGGMGHTVAIPFGAHQVRSQFAKFDPKNLGKSDLLGALTMGAPVGLLASMASREDGT